MTADRTPQYRECAPTKLSWPDLLAMAAKRGVKVWRAAEHGGLEEIFSIDQIGDRAKTRENKKHDVQR